MSLNSDNYESRETLEERLCAALGAGDAGGAENILAAMLNTAYIQGNDSLFIETRVRRLELFVLTEQINKAKAEYEALEELCGAGLLAEIRKSTNFDKITDDNSPDFIVRYPIDAEFLVIIKKISRTPFADLFNELKEKYISLDPKNKTKFEEYFALYPFWGTMDENAGDFGVIENRARALACHWKDFLWIYKKLQDYRSKITLTAFLKNWTGFDFEALHYAKEYAYKSYFDIDIFKCGPGEVFVDLGAYRGDTVADYVFTYGNYKRIYCYEITPSVFQTLKDNLKSLPDVVFRQKGAADKKGTMYMTRIGDSSSNFLSASGGYAVCTAAIDEDISEPVTFIKMDIEGGEQKALLGCAGHIRNSRPKLAVSVYHNNEDVWKIPRMIEEICPGYRFYLRYRGGSLIPSELCLLAVYPS